MRTFLIGIMLSLAVVGSVGCAAPTGAEDEIVDVVLAKSGKHDLATEGVDFKLTARSASKQMRVKLEAGIYSFGALLDAAPHLDMKLERVDSVFRRTEVALKTFPVASNEDGEYLMRGAAVLTKGTYVLTLKLQPGFSSQNGTAAIAGFGNVVTKPAALASSNFVASLDLGPWAAEDLEPSELKTFYSIASIVFASSGLDIVKPGTFTSVAKADILAAIASGVGQDGKALTAPVRAALTEIASSSKATALLRGETTTGKFYMILTEIDIDTSVVTAFALGTPAASN